VAKSQRKVREDEVPASARGRLHSVPGDALLGDDFDRLIHERVRLAIVSGLAVREWTTFNELKDLLELTDGNLSVHARRLEEAGYVECRKSFEGRVPKTEYRLTRTGHRALERYLGHIERLIRAVRQEE
jgi:DNA-binding HxlR family transcriptional regulator